MTLSSLHTLLIKMHEVHKVSLLGSNEVLVLEKRFVYQTKKLFALPSHKICLAAVQALNPQTPRHYILKESFIQMIFGGVQSSISHFFVISIKKTRRLLKKTKSLSVKAKSLLFILRQERPPWSEKGETEIGKKFYCSRIL